MKKLLLVLLLVFSFCNFAFCADLPDRQATPGYTNPAVTQENIKNTICVPGYTKTIRPTASYTTKLKLKQLKAGVYKSNLGAAAFEEDHLISLEIGGSPTDERNLWPQHWSSPYGAHEKDRLENKINLLICAGKITLAQAQHDVSTDWISSYKKYVGSR